MSGTFAPVNVGAFEAIENTPFETVTVAYYK